MRPYGRGVGDQHEARVGRQRVARRPDGVPGAERLVLLDVGQVLAEQGAQGIVARGHDDDDPLGAEQRADVGQGELGDRTVPERPGQQPARGIVGARGKDDRGAALECGRRGRLGHRSYLTSRCDDS